VSFSASFGATVPAGQIITATATDPNNNGSEFSKCVEVEGEPTPIPVGGIAEIRTHTDAPPAASRGSDDSALLMVVLGLGAVLVLGAGGLYVVKLRRGTAS
jgi:hypothetical protein